MPRLETASLAGILPGITQRLIGALIQVYGMTNSRFCYTGFPGRYTCLAITCIFAALFTVHSEPASAAIFKCIDAAGRTTYSSTACAAEESTQRISKTASALPELDCRVAEQFAADTVQRMSKGETSLDVFDGYGGMGKLSSIVVGMVGYIYSFHGSTTINDDRIVRLSTERCRVGSFGPVGRQCELFPAEFIERIGGCENARRDLTPDEPNGSDVYESTTDDVPEPYSIPKLGAASSARYLPSNNTDQGNRNGDLRPGDELSSTDVREDCRQRIRRTLAETERELAGSKDLQIRSRLSNRQRQLNNQLLRC